MRPVNWMRSGRQWAVVALVALAPVTARGEVFAADARETNRQRLQERVEYILSLSDQQAAGLVPVTGGGIYFGSSKNSAKPVR